jgi:hypothetical protein
MSHRSGNCPLGIPGKGGLSFVARSAEHQWSDSGGHTPVLGVFVPSAAPVFRMDITYVWDVIIMFAFTLVPRTVIARRQ